jgi:hypothetical protein
MDIAEEHLSNQPKVEGMDMAENHMVEDTMMDSVWVERVHQGLVMVKHQSNDGAEMNSQSHQEQWSGLEGY